MQRLQGKVAIVTGAGSGIGQGIAKRLGADGAKVIIDYVGSEKGADDTLKYIEAHGSQGHVLRADVTKMEDVRKLVDTAWDRFGSADILVNNAGMEKRSDFWDTPEEEYDRVMAVNLKGPFFLAQAFVRRLRDTKKPGRIINISSVHEDMAFPGFTTYCCSKGGLRMMMHNLTVELGPLGITINNIAPGAIITPINKNLLADKAKVDALLANIPLGRLGSVEDVASVVAFLASDEASYVSGATWFVDGGLFRNYHEQ
jgi:glucose 1-dehydrogenase